MNTIICFLHMNFDKTYSDKHLIKNFCNVELYKDDKNLEIFKGIFNIILDRKLQSILLFFEKNKKDKKIILTDEINYNIIKNDIFYFFSKFKYLPDDKNKKNLIIYLEGDKNIDNYKFEDLKIKKVIALKNYFDLLNKKTKINLIKCKKFGTFNLNFQIKNNFKELKESIFSSTEYFKSNAIFSDSSGLKKYFAIKLNNYIKDKNILNNLEETNKYLENNFNKFKFMTNIELFNFYINKNKNFKLGVLDDSIYSEGGPIGFLKNDKNKFLWKVKIKEIIDFKDYFYSNYVYFYTESYYLRKNYLTSIKYFEMKKDKSEEFIKEYFIWFNKDILNSDYKFKKSELNYINKYLIKIEDYQYINSFNKYKITRKIKNKKNNLIYYKNKKVNIFLDNNFNYINKNKNKYLMYNKFL